MYFSFLACQVIGNAVIKHQRPYIYEYLATDVVGFNSNGLFFFIFHRNTFNFEKNQKYLLRKFFDSRHTNNRIYQLQNCFWNFVYLKDTYITLKKILKILFVSRLRILLIWKFLNFTAVFTKKIKLSKVCIHFFVWES